MSSVWQDKFVTLLEELDEEAGKREINTPDYTVYARGDNGKFTSDQFRDYERGRRNIFEEYPIKLLKETE